MFPLHFVLDNLYYFLIYRNSIIMKHLLNFINEAESSIVNEMKNALKEELNAWYGYMIVKEWLTGANRKDIEKFYEDTAKDELEDHAYWLMKRINQLGGTIEDISLSPDSCKSAKHKYIAPSWSKDNIDIKKSLEDNIKKDIISKMKSAIKIAKRDKKEFLIKRVEKQL